MRAPDDGPRFVVAFEPIVHLAPGPYIARSARIERGLAWGRPTLTARFDVFADETLSAIVAQLPMYATLPRRQHRAPSRSKLGRWLKVAGVTDQGGHVPVEALRYRLWRVQVGSVMQDSERQPLPPTERYSVVRRVLEAFS